jgi:hypothetical protein
VSTNRATSGPLCLTHHRPHQGQYNGNFEHTYTCLYERIAVVVTPGSYRHAVPKGQARPRPPVPCPTCNTGRCPCRCMHFRGKQFCAAEHTSMAGTTLPNIFYLSAMLPADSPATHTESISGPTAREDDATIPLFADDCMDGHDSSRAGRDG